MFHKFRMNGYNFLDIYIYAICNMHSTRAHGFSID